MGDPEQRPASTSAAAALLPLQDELQPEGIVRFFEFIYFF